MGFKSRALPALEVLRADGVRCRGFLARDAVAPAPSMEPRPPSPHSPAPQPALQPPLDGRPSTELVIDTSTPDPIPDLRQLRRLSAFRRSA